MNGLYSALAAPAAQYNIRMRRRTSSVPSDATASASSETRAGSALLRWKILSVAAVDDPQEATPSAAATA
jgi:hypothetical protein